MVREININDTGGGRKKHDGIYEEIDNRSVWRFILSGKKNKNNNKFPER